MNTPEQRWRSMCAYRISSPQSARWRCSASSGRTWRSPSRCPRWLKSDKHIQVNIFSSGWFMLHSKSFCFDLVSTIQILGIISVFTWSQLRQTPQNLDPDLISQNSCKPWFWPDLEVISDDNKRLTWPFPWGKKSLKRRQKKPWSSKPAWLPLPLDSVTQKHTS